MEQHFFRKAKPIFLKGKSETLNTFAVFRTEIDSVQNAVMYITAFSFYRLTVNGRFVSFGPARTAKQYARVDILPLNSYIQEGKNEIVIEVAGYFCKSLSTVKQPSFLCAEIRSGESILAATGTAFEGFEPACKLQKVERYSRQRHFTEIWDYRNAASFTEEKDHHTIETLDLDLTFLDRTAPYPLYESIESTTAKLLGVLEFDDILPYKKEKYSGGYFPEDWGFWNYDDIEYHPHTWIQRQRQTVTQKEIALPLTLKKGEYVILDFGHIEVGFLKAQMEALAESEVIIAFTEYYEGDIFELPNMNAHNAIEYILPKGDLRDTMSFEPYSCRFVIIAVKDGEVKLNSFGIQTFMFDISKLEYPHYSDQTLDAIYRAAVRTFAHNAVDLYTDCPSRERAGWLCDSYFTAKTEYALTGKTAVEDAFLENYRYYKEDHNIMKGMIPMCYPADTIPKCEAEDRRFIPQWSMWYILEVADYLLNRGHEDKKEEFRHNIEMLLDFYRQYENSDGLLERLPSWNFVEWSIANDWTEDVNYPTNFLYAGVLDAVADIYGNDAYHLRADEVRKTTIAESYNGTYFHDHALRDENGVLKLQKDASEACQYYAILFGGFDLDAEPYKPLRKLVTDVFSPNRNGKMPEIFEVNAFIGAYLRMESLLRMGEYELLLRDIKDFFGNMEQYTGTLWEYRQFKGSDDHGFASYALVAIQKAMEALRT